MFAPGFPCRDHFGNIRHHVTPTSLLQHNLTYHVPAWKPPVSFWAVPCINIYIYIHAYIYIYIYVPYECMCLHLYIDIYI